MTYDQFIPVVGVVAVFQADDGSEFSKVLPVVGVTAAGHAYALHFDEDGKAIRPTKWSNFVRVDTEMR